MKIVSQQRRENIANYILYMWQVEDMIRACNLDIDLIERQLIKPLNLDESEQKSEREWYESLIDMMRRESVVERGHLQMNKNILGRLADLHSRLLADGRFPEYAAKFHKALPHIVELRAKAGENPAGEIETCFNALYGLLMLKLKGQQISDATAKAMSDISGMIAMLAAYDKLEQDDKLFNDDGSVATLPVKNEQS